MDSSTDIVIPFDFPFAILEHRTNPDSNKKLVYAVADGQFTYGPLSLFQYHNDEKYSKLIRSEQLPSSLPCKEFYIVESDLLVDHTIEIIDRKRGRIYVKEIEHEPQQIRMNELMHEMTECKNELRSLKSIVLSENRMTRQSSSNMNISSTSTTAGDLSTPVRQKKQIQSTFIKKNVNTPPRSHSVTSTRILYQNIRSSGYGQQIPAIATPTRSSRR